MSAPINWALPIELIDGTPVCIRDRELQPDPEGHYRVTHETIGELVGSDDTEWGGCGRVFVDQDGRWWLALDGDEPIVRNRSAAA